MSNDRGSRPFSRHFGPDHGGQPSRQRVLPGLALAQTAKRKLTCPGDVGAFFIKENGVARSVKQVSKPAHEGFELVRVEQEIDSDDYWNQELGPNLAWGCSPAAALAQICARIPRAFQPSV